MSDATAYGCGAAARLGMMSDKVYAPAIAGVAAADSGAGAAVDAAEVELLRNDAARRRDEFLVAEVRIDEAKPFDSDKARRSAPATEGPATRSVPRVTQATRLTR